MDAFLTAVANNLGITVAALRDKLNATHPDDGRPIGGLSKSEVRTGVIPAISALGGGSMRIPAISGDPKDTASARTYLTHYMSLLEKMLMSYTPTGNNVGQSHVVTIRGIGSGMVEILDPASGFRAQPPMSIDAVIKLFLYPLTSPRSSYLVVPSNAPRPDRGYGP